MSPARLLFLTLPLLCCFCTRSTESPTPAFPLWDNVEPVSEYAKRVNFPPTQTLDLGNGVKLELVLIPGGRFTMGTPEPPVVDEAAFQKQIVTSQALLAVSAGVLLVLFVFIVIRAIKEKRRPQLSLGRLIWVTVLAGGALMSGMHWRYSVQAFKQAKAEYAAAKARYDAAQPEEKPAHGVTLTKPFYLGKFTVTQEQYQAVMGSNPSNFKGKDNPVEQVSWEDAQEFLKKLSEKTKQDVRLPTEAEWEYSCRAGTTTTYHSGDTEADLARVAWYGGNSKKTTHPVGQKDPNKFGLCDMHGNVWQWCQDWFGEDYYGKSEAENPAGPAQGTSRLLRGGSWIYFPMGCRSAFRFGYYPDIRYSYIGFRIVLVPSFRTP